MQRLTDDMRRDWVEKGYLLLKGALTHDQIAGYLAATDEVIAKYRETHPEAREQDALNIIQTVERSPDFDSLIDHLLDGIEQPLTKSQDAQAYYSEFLNQNVKRPPSPHGQSLERHRHCRLRSH